MRQYTGAVTEFVNYSEQSGHFLHSYQKGMRILNLIGQVLCLTATNITMSYGWAVKRLEKKGVQQDLNQQPCERRPLKVSILTTKPSSDYLGILLYVQLENLNS